MVFAQPVIAGSGGNGLMHLNKTALEILSILGGVYFRAKYPFFAELFKCAPQYELDSYVTVATYWVPELSNIKGFSGHLWRSVLIFAIGTSYA